MQNKPKHALKDSVFKNLFSDRKYLLQLYKSLHPEDTKATEADLEDVTINPVFMGSEYNDLGFSVGDRLITLVESQSTWSVNILIRAFLYLADTYNNYFKRTKQSLYASKKAEVPTPELYVIYTGSKKEVPEYITFKEEFLKDENCAIDVKIKVLSSEYEKTIIGEYIAFCKVYDDQVKLYGRTRKAIEETLRICKDKNILAEYLREHESEVQTIMMILFDEDYLSSSYEATLKKEAREWAKQIAEREIAQRVERETAQRVERETAQRVERETAQRVERETFAKAERETARKMLAAGTFTTDQISEFSGLSVSEIEKLKADSDK